MSKFRDKVSKHRLQRLNRRMNRLQKQLNLEKRVAELEQKLERLFGEKEEKKCPKCGSDKVLFYVNIFTGTCTICGHIWREYNTNAVARG